jgi:hypothetical protein
LKRSVATRAQPWLVRIGIALLCAASATLALGEDRGATPYTVKWPAGWELTHLPTARTNSGKQLGGERFRAVRSEAGAPAAAIELTLIPRNDKGQVSLAYEFEVALRTIQSGYAQKNLTVDLGSLQNSPLGGLPAMSTEISISGAGVHLKQWLAMAVSPGYVYALTYSGNDANYASYRPQFEQLKAGLVLR